jgi:diguanylate cyclase
VSGRRRLIAAPVRAGSRTGRGMRLATACLVVGLALVTAVTMGGALLIHQASGRAARAKLLAVTFNSAAGSVTVEQSLIRQYRLEGGGPAVRSRALTETASMERSLNRIRAVGDGPDRAVADDVGALSSRYTEANSQLIDAVDRSASVSDQIEIAGRSDAIRQEMSLHLDGAAGRASASADAALVRLNQITTTVLAGIAASAVLAGALLSVLARAISQYRRRLEEETGRALRQALQDPLTGLASRAHFAALTRDSMQSLEQTHRQKDQVDPSTRQGVVGPAIAVFDMRRFKEINETLGHDVGDQVLTQVAQRLQADLPVGTSLARLGADEFAALLTPPDSLPVGQQRRWLRDTTGDLLGRLRAPLTVGEVSLLVETSAGLAITQDLPAPTDHATEPSTALLRAANLALDAAQATQADLVVFDSAVHVGADPGRLPLLADLRRALNDAGEIDMHYQPQLAVDGQAVIGVEALVRWQHPQHGPIPPSAFIPAAETSGLITDLTDRVLHLALAQARRWLDRGEHLPVSVNLSARSLTDAALARRIRIALEHHQVPVELLRLEVTESAVMTDPAKAFDLLHQLRSEGLAISMDDFGAGQTSIAHLQQGTFDELKIDRSLIAGITNTPNGTALVGAVIELGHALGLRVVAEGVESADQYQTLRDLGCDASQGYLHSRPRPADQFDRWLTTHRDSLLAATRSQL